MHMALFDWKTFPNGSFTFPDYNTEEGETRYYLTPKGKYPSMTSVLKLLDDGGIERWRKRVGEEEADRITKEASERGNELHELVELYLTNQLTRPMVTQSNVAPLFNRIRQHYEDFTMIHGVEVALYSDHYGIAGRVDVLANKGNTFYVCDTKNSRNPINTSTSWGQKKLLKYKLQITGYAMMINEMYGLVPTRGRICVANYETMNSEQFDFPIDVTLIKEFDYLVQCYHNGVHPSESEFFKL